MKDGLPRYFVCGGLVYFRKDVELDCDGCKERCGVKKIRGEEE